MRDQLKQNSRYKSFVKKVTAALILFVMFHYITWILFTKSILAITSEGGDLARMGYQVNSKHQRLRDTTLEKHISYKQWNQKKIDVITIGDSFSSGAAGGKNAYYQDYITSKKGVQVLNILPTCTSPSSAQCNYLETVLSLYNSGTLKKINPKYIIIESVSRYATTRLSQNTDWSPTFIDENMTGKLKRTWHMLNPSYGKNYQFVNTGNYKYYLYNFLYYFSPNAYALSNVYKLPLKASMFSVKSNNTLLFFEDDLKNIPKNSIENIRAMNDNLNRLASLLKKQNITLIFLPIVDKYDLYYPYIKSNPYPYNPFFDIIRQQKKDYVFIDTKKILDVQLRAGKKDIYYADDTHWSYSASDAVVQSISFFK